MDYKRVYHSLVKSRKSRGLDKSRLDFVTERHHIVPISLGGNSEESNLVLLTGREHYLAHLLLTKYSKGSEYYKCLYALANFRTDRYGTRCLNSRQIGKARDAVQRLIAEGKHVWKTEKYCLYMKARNAAESLAGEHNFQSNAFKLYKSEFQKQTLHCHCGKTGKRGGMGKAHMLNCKYKPYMSFQLALLGLNASMQISLVKYAEVHKTPTACPHCGKVGKGPMQLRWHFDNCKFTNS